MNHSNTYTDYTVVVQPMVHENEAIRKHSLFLKNVSVSHWHVGTRKNADGLQLSWLIIHSPVYTIYTFCTVATWIAVTLIDVDLTVRARGAWLAAALVAINEVLTVSSKLARVALTLVDLCLAQVPSETWVAVACEWVLPIDTLATMTWGALTVIYVCFTVST